MVDVLVGAGYLALGTVGPVAAGTSLKHIAADAADHALHLAVGAVLLGIGLFADRRPAA